MRGRKKYVEKYFFWKKKTYFFIFLKTSTKSTKSRKKWKNQNFWNFGAHFRRRYESNFLFRDEFMMCTKERGAGKKNPTTGFFIFRVKNDHKIRFGPLAARRSRSRGQCFSSTGQTLTRPKKTFTVQFIIPASGSLVHIINSSLNKRLQPKGFQKFSKSDLSIGQDELGDASVATISPWDNQNLRSKLILDRIFLGLLYWEVRNFFFRDEFMMCTNDPEVGSKN